MCQERSANFSLGLRALDVTLVILPYHYDILYIIIIFTYYFSILTVATHIMTAVKDSRVIHVSRITPQVVWSFISTTAAYLVAKRRQRLGRTISLLIIVFLL